jgi:hypothetical protein
MNAVSEVLGIANRFFQSSREPFGAGNGSKSQASGSSAIVDVIEVSLVRGKTLDDTPFERVTIRFISAYFGETSGIEQMQDSNPINTLIDNLKDIASPENTAKRIYQFAISRYGIGSFDGENTVENRKKYVDYILPAVENGIAEAKEILASFPEDIMSQVDETDRIIHNMFDSFLAEIESRES